MKTITIEKPAVCQTTLDYLTRGHIVGELSGAALRGKAHKYGAFYARKRYQAATIAARYRIYSSRILINSRWCRVWADNDNNPVRILFA